MDEHMTLDELAARIGMGKPDRPLGDGEFVAHMNEKKLDKAREETRAMREFSHGLQCLEPRVAELEVELAATEEALVFANTNRDVWRDRADKLNAAYEKLQSRNSELHTELAQSQTDAAVARECLAHAEDVIVLKRKELADAETTRDTIIGYIQAIAASPNCNRSNADLVLEAVIEVLESPVHYHACDKCESPVQYGQYACDWCGHVQKAEVTG